MMVESRSAGWPWHHVETRFGGGDTCRQTPPAILAWQPTSPWGNGLRRRIQHRPYRRTTRQLGSHP